MEEIFNVIYALKMSPNDFFTLVPIFILVSIIFYLSNKEIQKSLELSKRTEELLSKDMSTLRRELKEAREQRLAELAKAAEFGRLSQGLFHDLMTPLTSIILHTEKLKGSDIAQQNIEKAVEASKRMAVYIKDIRATLSREEEKKICRVGEEIGRVVNFYSYIAREKGVKIEVNETNNVLWRGQPTKIRQLLSNLISNALDSFDNIDRDRKIISIKLDKFRDTIMLTIKDNGCGINDLDQGRIFEPFFTTKPIDKGTGIGLATVKSVVEKDLCGHIEVKSKVGQGTKFTINFPDNIDPASSLPPQ